MAFKYHISFASQIATYLAANFGFDWFRIMPDIVSKLLRTAIWSSCAVQLESEHCEQTPFPRTGHQLRSAALHRILFWTWGFDPISYFYSETNEWLQDWAKWWATLGVASVCNNFLPIQSKISFHMKKVITAALHLESIKTFLTFELSQYCKSSSTCSSSKPVEASSDCHRLGKALFLLASSTCPSCAGVVPQELGHWFCS